MSSGTKKAKKIPQSGEGIMMILSPAKTLDLSPFQARSSLPTTTTLPTCEATQTRQIVQAMKSRRQAELTKLLGISANLGQTAYGYWQDFQDDEDSSEARAQAKPCVYAFTGVAYQGLQIDECSDEAVLYLQNNLRIIDPLYGVLRPLDAIQPYRLEMATKHVFAEDKTIKLQNFWKEPVTARLRQDLENRSTKIVLNIASDEYSSAVDRSNLPPGTSFVKVVFYNGGRVVAVHAKRARGLMARFVAEHQCQSLEDVKQFDYEGYSLVASKSNDLSLVFDRTKEDASSSKRKTAADGKSTKKRKK